MENYWYITFQPGKSVGITMKIDDEQITQEEARITLNALENIKKQAISSMRPPLWLNFCAALLVGTFTFAYFFREQSAVLQGVFVAAALLFLFSYMFWLLRLRTLGVTQQILPRNFAGKAFMLLQAVFYMLVMAAAGRFHGQGMTSAPYLAGLINCIAFAYLTHYYPTGEWISWESR